MSDNNSLGNSTRVLMSVEQGDCESSMQIFQRTDSNRRTAERSGTDRTHIIWN